MFSKYGYIIVLIIVVVLPLVLIKNILLALAVVILLLFAIYFITRYMRTNKLHKRNFAELRESKTKLNDGGFLFNKTVSFSNVTAHDSREWANLQVKEKGLLVRPLVSLGFSILYEDISKVEIVSMYDPAGQQASHSVMSIFITHKGHSEPEVFLFQFDLAEDFLQWLSMFYKGEILHKDYQKFIQGIKGED